MRNILLHQEEITNAINAANGLIDIEDLPLDAEWELEPTKQKPFLTIHANPILFFHATQKSCIVFTGIALESDQAVYVCFDEGDFPLLFNRPTNDNGFKLMGDFWEFGQRDKFTTLTGAKFLFATLCMTLSEYEKSPA